MIPLLLLFACEGGPGLLGGEGLQFEDYGDQAISDTGEYVELLVDIPGDAVSAMVHCGEYGDQRLGAVLTLENPSGANVYAGPADEAPNKQNGTWRSEFLDDMSPALLPLSPKLDISAGKWTFNYFIGAGPHATANCGAVFRLDSVGNQANINIELVFVGLSDLDASSAPDDTDFQAVLDHFESEWSTGNLKPNFGYADFSGNASKYTVVDVSDDDLSEFNDLLRTAKPFEERTLTIFLVEEISNSSQGGDTILGLSAGPPGAAAIHGTSKSGVVISAADLKSAPTDVAKIMAHESAHFLGLFHTTEKGGTQFDPLDDTPVCPAGSTSLCASLGADNIMWWTLTDGVATFTSDQSWVARRNPVAY
jgi:hypothetical protein